MSNYLWRNTWPRVKEYLLQNQGILIPIGSTEQHGPTGWLGTDALCAQFVAAAVSERTGALIGPTVSIGMAQHHLSFPGSITLRPSTMLLFIKDYVRSLHTQGFRKFFFVNGHGGNIATLRAAIDEIYTDISLADNASLDTTQCIFRNWWDPEAVGVYCSTAFGLRDGDHATASEFSLLMIDDPDFDPSIAGSDLPSSGSFTHAGDFRRRFVDGRVGSDPSLASKEHGVNLMALAADGLATDYLEFTRGQPSH